MCNPKNVKKLRNGNLLVDVQMKKHAENILKIDKFHNIKCKAYPHARLNTSISVIRSREHSLAKPEEIEMALQK